MSKAFTFIFLVFSTFYILGLGQDLQSPIEFLDVLFKNAPRLGPQLPSPTQFLETLFNETAGEISTVSKNFYFRDVKPDDIKFLVLTKNGSFKEVDFDSAGNISAEIPTKIVIHGWQSQGDTKFIKDLVNSYSKIGITNIIAVDWQKHSKRNYIHAASSTMNVGKIVADFILKMIKKEGKLLKNIHLLGHSLGAQISGFAGKRVKMEIDARVGRITALDAAAPIFEFPIKMPAQFRISSGDADFVDGIHTNAGFFGFLGPFATADYYINNGGPIQPGCVQENIVETFFCSHSMSHDIYNKSISSKQLKATSCPNVALYRTRLCALNDKVVMGEHASTKAIGTFFFDE